jgi:hypothetical protein
MASNPIKENEKENVVDTGVRVYRFRVTVLSPSVSGQSSIQHPLLERACLTFSEVMGLTSENLYPLPTVSI